jgi:YqaJ-like viral recombinase domain
MTVTIHKELIQGSPEWLQARCGLLTASEMCKIVTPAKLKAADNDTSRGHLYELVAQRYTQYVEPTYIGAHMLRGEADEGEALNIYEDAYEPGQRVGFITNDRWGFTLGFSPDLLVGEKGFVEVKSRIQRLQVQTILDAKMPDDFLLQVQTGLLVSERQWCDFVSFSAGLPMFTLRVFPDEEVQAAIIAAATKFHARLDEEYERIVERMGNPDFRLIPTERRDDTIVC